MMRTSPVQMLTIALLYGGLIAATACTRALESHGVSAPAHNTLTPAEIRDGWQLVFDGQTLEGWRGLGREDIPEGHWIVEDGMLVKVSNEEVPRMADGQPLQGGDLLLDRKLSNFELTFEWRISHRGNSGIKYNVSEELSTAHRPYHGALGFEYQVLDDPTYPALARHPTWATAGLYDLIAPNPDVVLNPTGEWNSGRIVFQGNRGEHWLNRVKAVEYELGTPRMDSLLAASKWHDIPEFGIRRDSAYIALQDHGDAVWYRNIKIRELPPR